MISAFEQMGILAKLSLVVAVIPAVMGVAYAIWPNEAKLSLMRPLSLASLFGGLSGFVAGMINMLHYAGTHDAQVVSTTMMAIGAAESLVPLCVSFGSLTIAWLLVALGLRRQT